MTCSETKFLELYENRLIEDFPGLSIDDVDDMLSDEEPVSAYFGSSGYTIHPLNISHYENSTIFTNGFCVLFAHVFAQEYGHDSFLLLTSKDSDEDEWTGHILVKAGEDVLIDAKGANSLNDVKSEYPIEHYDYEEVTFSDLWDKGILDKNQYGDPLDFIDEFEQEFSKRYVKNIYMKTIA